MSTDTNNTNKRTDKSSSESGAYIVCKGATCKCDQGSSGPVEIQITSQNKAYINGNQLVATIKDANLMVPAMPFVTCALSPKKQAGQPCEYQPTASWEWNSAVGNEHPEIAGLKILTENAILKCPAYPGTISIVTHGQQIDVANNAAEEIDESVAVAIICLFEKIETKEQNKVIPDIAFVTHGNFKTSKDKIIEIPLRKDFQYEFNAQYTKATQDALYSYWYIRPKKESEKTKIAFDPAEGLLYKQSGNKIAIKIQQAGNYFIEGFGQLTYKKGGKKVQLFNQGTFLLNVQENKFKKNQYKSIADRSRR